MKPPLFRLTLAGLAPLSLWATVLGDLSAQMKPGDWRELSTGGLNQSFLETSGFNASSHSILQYGSKAQWDPVTEQFLFMGSPHDNPYKFVIYDAKTNAWRQGPLPLTCLNGGSITGNGCLVHSYYYSDIDPAGRRFLYWMKTMVYQYNIDRNTWGLFSNPTPVGLDYGGFAYFPERNAFIAVSGWKGNYYYDRTTNKWSSIDLPATFTNANYHLFAWYFPAHKAVLFGGGNTSRNIFKMTADGRITQLRDSPVNIVACPTHFVYDPVTGDGLLMKHGSFWAHDVSADAWRSLPSPPYAPLNNDCEGAVAAPVNTYGVVLYLTYEPAKVYIYKHAEASAIEGGGKALESRSIGIAPNPFRSATAIRAEGTIKIYDLNGRMVADLSNESSAGIGATWRPSHLSAGLYVVKTRSGDRSLSATLFYQK